MNNENKLERLAYNNGFYRESLKVIRSMVWGDPMIPGSSVIKIINKIDQVLADTKPETGGHPDEDALLNSIFQSKLP